MPSNTDNVKAVLVRLSIRIFPNTRQDQDITEEVRAKKALGIGAGKWVKHIFPEDALKLIREAGGNARRRHYDMTLPWEEGYRLLPSAAHASYDDQMKEFQKVFTECVEAFGDKYDVHCKAAKVIHGKTYDPSLYPEWGRMALQFGFAVEYTPMPRAGHFIVDGIAKDAVQEMRQELETHNAQRVQAAVKDTWMRLMTPIQAIAGKLTDNKAIFRDSLIQNVRDICTLVPGLNLTGDRQLENMAKQINERFANLDPDVLRENNTIRQEAAAAARELVQQFGKIGKRRFA